MYSDKHSSTLIDAHTHTFKNLYISSSKHAMIHKAHLLYPCFSLVCTYFKLSSLTFTLHLTQKHWKPSLHSQRCHSYAHDRHAHGSALRSEALCISISCTFILTSYFALVSFLSQRKSRGGGCWVNFGTGR